jgi:transposase
MMSLTFSEAVVAALHYERYHHPHPRVQQKMEALDLKSHNLSHSLIAQLVGVCETTLRTYFHEYQQGGVERLKQLNFYQPQSALAAHAASLEERFHAHPVATVAEAPAVIEQHTGIKRSPTQVRQFLRRLGLQRRKVGVIPAKADVEQQQTFKAQQLDPRIAQAKAGERAPFFVDGAHFVFGAFLGFLWSFVRVLVKTASGRQRLNVLGALNPLTFQILTVINETYVTADTVCQLLMKIAALGLTVPVTVVLDNARYQGCALVQQTAQRLNIELLFLPPYSPNLNLIERFWKFVKKQCLYSQYYEDFTRALLHKSEMSKSLHTSSFSLALCRHRVAWGHPQMNLPVQHGAPLKHLNRLPRKTPRPHPLRKEALEPKHLRFRYTAPMIPNQWC